MSNPISIKVEAKVIGQRRALFTDYPIPLTAAENGQSRMKLRELLESLVLHEVQAFRERQAERRLSIVLTPKQIEEGAVRGKIDSGERDLGQTVDEAEALKTALQAFEDGLYYVFLDNTQIESLDEDLVIQNDSRLMLVRLVALAGG